MAEQDFPKLFSVIEAYIEIFRRPVGFLGVISISHNEAICKILYSRLQERIYDI